MSNHKRIKIGHWLCTIFVIYLAVISFYIPREAKIAAFILYGVINFLIILFTVQDKSAAKRGKPRISELRFYVLSLLGGWFGGYITQQWCRHKTQKQPFRSIYWCCAWLHIGVIAALSFLYLK